MSDNATDAGGDTREHIAGLVVPTTHWDRAWYWPFERFRVKLIEMFVGVERMWTEDPDYRFTMDGQSLAVEDYLEVFPEKEDLLRQMGDAGRFKMGPLYVLCDMWCTGGEAFIRNWLTGVELADRLHARESVLYQPDAFGFPPCMPMLVRGLGGDTFIFMRGMPEDATGGSRFMLWRSADSSEIRVCHLREGYANAARLGQTRGTGEIMDKSTGIHPGFDMGEAVAKLRAAAEKLRDGQGEPHLFLAGVDHQIPQPELPEILRRARDEGTDFRYSDLDEVAELLKQRDPADWPIYEGEMNAPAASRLAGTISARIYLKQTNAETEQLLLRAAEPADAILSLLDIPEQSGAVIRTAWKTLLRVHPHDDITGCGVDAVHREDEANITRAQQSANAFARRAAHLLVQHFGGQRPDDDRPGFVVFPTHGSTTTRRVRAVVDFEGRRQYGDTPPPAHYRLVDEQGAPVPFHELRRGPCTEHPHQQVELEFASELQPFTLQRFFFEEQPLWPREETASTLENEYLRATVNANGTVDILHKKTGQRWQELGTFSDQADIGDEYTFAPIADEEETLLADLEWRRVTDFGCSGLQIIALEAELPVPVCSSASGRSGTRAGLPIRIEYTLAPGERHLQCRICFRNRARDHRLRWGGVMPGVTESRAGLKFSEARRPVTGPQPDGDYVRFPLHPTDHYVACDGDQGGLAVFTPFPMIYEVVTGETPRLALTILRAVGMLSVRNETLTRGPGAGPGTPTPEAQCLREFDMTFAIRPYAQEESDMLFAESIQWRSPVLHGVLWGADPAWTENTQNDPLLTLDAGPIAVSSLKRSQDRRHTILRLFNSSNCEASTTLRGRLTGDLTPVLLSEEPSGSPALEANPDGVSVTMPPYSLRSFRSGRHNP